MSSAGGTHRLSSGRHLSTDVDDRRLLLAVLRRHRSKLLGVLFGARDPFHADLLEAIYPAAERRGYQVVLSARLPTRPEHQAADALIGSRCEGIILLGSERPGRRS
jgi:DNA-binding LacI/PurR family transcriptional regulator